MKIDAKKVLISLIIITLLAFIHCSRNIIQYKPLAANDTILMIGNYGGKSFFLNKKIIRNSPKLKLFVKEGNILFKIKSYNYSDWGRDFCNIEISDSLNPYLVKSLDYKNTKGFIFYHIEYLDADGNSHVLEKSGKYYVFFALFKN